MSSRVAIGVLAQLLAVVPERHHHCAVRMADIAHNQAMNNQVDQ